MCLISTCANSEHCRPSSSATATLRWRPWWLSVTTRTKPPLVDKCWRITFFAFCMSWRKCCDPSTCSWISGSRPSLPGSTHSRFGSRSNCSSKSQLWTRCHFATLRMQTDPRFCVKVCPVGAALAALLAANCPASPLGTEPPNERRFARQAPR